MLRSSFCGIVYSKGNRIERREAVTVVKARVA